MKIAVTALGDKLSSMVDPRFGRAKYFLIIDPDTMEYEVITNDGMNSVHGAGIQAGQLMSSKDVSVLITGNVGPNAFMTLSAANIQVYQSGDQSVAKAIEQFKNNQLVQINEAGPAHGGLPT